MCSHVLACTQYSHYMVQVLTSSTVAAGVCSSCQRCKLCWTSYGGMQPNWWVHDCTQGARADTSWYMRIAQDVKGSVQGNRRVLQQLQGGMHASKWHDSVIHASARSSRYCWSSIDWPQQYFSSSVNVIMTPCLCCCCFISTPWQVAVGEVGLDFSPHVLKPKHQSPDSSSCLQQHPAAAQPETAGATHEATVLSEEELKEVQRGVFQQQILLANDLGLPVNVHSRSAGHHAVRARA